MLSRLSAFTASLLGLLVWLMLALPAQAQNYTCPTAPVGTSNNQCASTAFVQTAISAPNLPNDEIFVGQANNLAAPVPLSGDCTIVASGTITCTTLNSVLPGTLFPLNAGTGLSISGGNLNITGTITAAGPIGAADTVPVITYNAQGQLTAVTTATITPAAIGGVPSSRTISTTAPLAGGGDLSADRTFSITGAAGQVLAGAGPAFTPTPVLGVAGSTTGTLAFANLTSGSITLAPVSGALGSSVLSLPAATDTLVGKATTDIFLNKSYDTAGTGNVFKINGNTVSAVTGTGNTVVLSAGPTITGHPTIEGVTSTGATGTGKFVFDTSPSVSGLTVTGSFTATGLVTNADLVNAATTVNGTTCTLGSTCTITAAASLIVGTTSITSGTTNYLLYNNAGTLGNEASTAVVFGTGTLSLSGNLTTTGAFNPTFAIGGSVTYTFPGSGANMAALNIADQTISGGGNVTSLSQSTGSITVDCGARPLQYITGSASAWVITAPANDGSCILLLTNPASSVNIPTFSGFTVGSTAGSALTAVANSKFYISIWRINGTSGYSVTAAQ